ncbi:Pectate lyase superfamily protein [Paenibacillus sp. UNCCL117]|uniref:right-handed parallel beta-helix repeat-containing protein n=1 Tax=unclassified Paenibacillus TaxID=185978 RepID=UPI000888D3E4|nr:MULTISPECIES: right-handed parallel beta-helix repeat-containing protein [unclassified Paenibacillus]SDC37343.1 Pectate lyase superfamily protein [Paenibacillus sp. cl123]SFW14729.1 Pectate lyase superfamily protein [Paenibacillus sp. UNCCL117]
MNNGKAMSRRSFIAGLGAVGGLMAAPGLLAGTGRAYAAGSPPAQVEWHKVTDHGVAGDGIQDNAAALTALIASVAGAAEATFYFPPGQYRLGSAVTFPSRLRLVFDYGAMLTPDSSVVAVVNSHVEAAVTTIFGGDGEVTGNFHGAPVYPQWWGAKGDKTSDDTVPFKKVFRLARDIGQEVTVIVPKGDYVWSSVMVIYGKTSVRCEQGATFWRNHPNTMLINFEPNGQASPGYSGNGNILFENARFEFVAYNPPSLCYEDGNVLQFAHASDWTFRHCEFYDLIDGHAIEINSSQNVTIEDCKFYGYRELATDRWYVEAVQLDLAYSGGISGALPADNTPCKNVTVRNCYFGKGRSYTFMKAGISQTVTFRAWPCGVGGHSHKEGRFHQNISIRNNTFEGMTYFAIHPYKWLNTIITENYFFECGGGIYAVCGPNHATFGAAGPLRRLVISNNQFINMQSIFPDHNSTLRRFAIGIISMDIVSEDVRIEGNIISVGVDSAITVRNINRISITGNTMNYMTHAAVEISGSSHVELCNNQVYQPTEHAFYLFDNNYCQVTGNQIRKATMHALLMTNCNNASVHDNVLLETTQDGIRMENVQHLSIRSNQIHKSNHAVQLLQCSDVEVAGNKLIDMVYNYLYIRQVTDFLIIANIFTEPETTVYDAIRVAESSQSGIVRDNLLRGTYRYGIWFDTTTGAAKYGYNSGGLRNDSSLVQPLQD